MNVRSVLITGGASGIGLACAQRFADDGWRVVLADRDSAALVAAVALRPAQFVAAEMDVTDLASVQAACAVAASAGGIHALVNNAGIQQWMSLERFDTAVWERVLDVNLTGVVRCLSAAIPFLIAAGGGAVVNIASISARGGVPQRAPYSASKAAVVALTATAAVELASHGIRVNAVAPGYVDTELIGRYVASGSLDLRPILARIPLGRLARPHEIADAVLFLAGASASYITGQTLFVDGGFLADAGVPGGSPSPSVG
jgi:3-oxoacyl-[acyl-carrier protein] reductase